MDKNIKVPLSLLLQIIDLLEYWDISQYDPVICQDYNNVISTLMKKKQSIELRDSYVKIINAENEDDRDEARMRYLHKKQLLNEEF